MRLCVFGGKLAASAAVFAALATLAVRFRITSYLYLAFALAGSLVIYLWTRPGAKSLAATLASGAGFASIYAIVTGEGVLFSFPAFLGLGSLASLSLGALWGRPAIREAHLDTCITAALFPMFLITAGLSLMATASLYPKTFDLYLYAFDGRLGFQPSFLVGRLLEWLHPLRQACYFGYEALPLAMATAFAMERRRRGPPRASFMAAFMLASVGGFLLYNVCPAAGPVHVFGKQFPHAPPVVERTPRLVEIGDAPRNGMPSVHIAMALLIWWQSWRGSGVWRVIAGGLLGLTVLATLGFGEHYLIDLVVAAPFAVAVQALASTGLPWRSPARIGATAGGLALVAGWLVYLRMPWLPVFGPVWTWVLLAGTVVVSLVLEQALAASGRLETAWEASSRPKATYAPATSQTWST